MVTMSQQVGIALGSPVMAAVVSAFAIGALLPGLRVAIAVNAVGALVAALMMGLFFRLPAIDCVSR